MKIEYWFKLKLYCLLKGGRAYFIFTRKEEL